MAMPLEASQGKRREISLRSGIIQYSADLVRIIRLLAARMFGVLLYTSQLATKSKTHFYPLLLKMSTVVVRRDVGGGASTKASA